MSHEEIGQRSYFKKASQHLKKLSQVEKTQYCSWCCESFKTEDKEMFCSVGCLRTWALARYERDATLEE
jgi:hypothetical protein